MDIDDSGALGHVSQPFAPSARPHPFAGCTNAINRVWLSHLLSSKGSGLIVRSIGSPNR